MNMEKGSDGKVVPDSGQRIDDVLMEKIRDRNRSKTAAAQ